MFRRLRATTARPPLLFHALADIYREVKDRPDADGARERFVTECTACADADMLKAYRFLGLL